MFEHILEQVAGRFGLAPDKAKQLLGMLVAVIFNPQRGGPAGFVQAFRDKGLGDVVGSWLGSGPNQPISAAQLENVIGGDTLAGIGSKLGLPTATVGAASAALLPEAVHQLSEHGELPTTAAGIPDRLKGWFGNLGDDLGDVGQRSAPAVGAAADATARGGRALWPWLLLAAAVIAGFLVLRGCRKQEAVLPAETAPVATETPAATSARQIAADVDAAATAAFAKLRPGGFSADDLVKALNLMIVHFDTDSARISARSEGILEKAAAAIKQAPAGTRIEVGGHTDNTGDAGANLDLSQRRADAVRTRLGELGVAPDTLSSKGYGQDRPVADNASEDGRARNRRIEFTVQK